MRALPASDLLLWPRACVRACFCLFLLPSIHPSINPSFPFLLLLVVEESDSRVAHGNPVIVAGFRDLPVLHASTGLCHVRHPELGGVIDGIPKGEKGVAGNGDPGRVREEFLLLVVRQGLGDLREHGVPPDLFLVGEVSLDVSNARVDAVLSLDSLPEGKGQDLGVLSQVPRLYLAAGELDAVDPGLLARTDPDHHAILGESDRVALGVLDADGGDNEIAHGGIGDGSAPGRVGDDRAHVFARQHRVVALLAKGHSVDLAVLVGSRFVVLCGLQDDESPALFRFENGQCLGGVSRSDDSVADLLLQVEGRLFVHNVRDGAEISETAHGIGVAGTQVGQRDGGQRGAGLFRDLVGLALDVRQGDRNGGSRRTDVLEGGGRCQSGGFPEFPDQLPGVGGVQEVDVSGRSVEDLKGELVSHAGENRGRLLVWIASVLELEFRSVHAGDDHVPGEGLWLVVLLLLLDLLGKIGSNHAVVLGGEGKGLGGAILAGLEGGTPVVFREFLEECIVLVGVGDDGGRDVVLGSGSHHRGSTDVDVFHALFEGDVFPLHGRLEGIQVENRHVDVGHALGLHVGVVLGVSSDGQETSVDLGMECLDASVQALGAAGEVGNIPDVQT
mmetsp:Transcript_4387/g.12597  ORF Transcript_4387/g.12597 Transcript_4387/m.12597 type:complete len:615 (-) Transcript_4387:273-2117(-)